MTSIALPLPPLTPGAPPEDPGGLASLLLRRALLGMLLGLAIGCSQFAGTLPLLIDAGAGVVATLHTIVLRSIFKFAVLVVLITLVLHFAASVMVRIAGIALAMYCTMRLGGVLPELTGYFEDGGFDMARTLFHMDWVTLAIGTLVAWYLVYWGRTRRSLRALRAAQLAQQRAEHGVLESRLNVLRARVDPEFLFEALGAARRLYAGRPEVGEHLLEVLIEYLRVAVPQGNEQGSSLAEELNLAATYLEVRAAVSGIEVALEADVAPEFAGAFFPPRLLMPLVEDAARRGRGDSPRIRVQARVAGDVAQVTLEDMALASSDDARLLEETAMTLRAFFGPDARAHAQATPAGRRFTFEFTHVAAGKDPP